MKSANNIHLILQAHRSLPAINRILLPSRGYSTPGGGDYSQTIHFIQWQQNRTRRHKIMDYSASFIACNIIIKHETISTSSCSI